MHALARRWVGTKFCLICLETHSVIIYSFSMLKIVTGKDQQQLNAATIITVFFALFPVNLLLQELKYPVLFCLRHSG